MLSLSAIKEKLIEEVMPSHNMVVHNATTIEEIKSSFQRHLSQARELGLLEDNYFQKDGEKDPQHFKENEELKEEVGITRQLTKASQKFDDVVRLKILSLKSDLQQKTEEKLMMQQWSLRSSQARSNTDSFYDKQILNYE